MSKITRAASRLITLAILAITVCAPASAQVIRRSSDTATGPAYGDKCIDANTVKDAQIIMVSVGWADSDFVKLTGGDGKRTILILSSPAPTVWDLSKLPKDRLAGVILAYDRSTPQAVIGIANDVTIEDNVRGAQHRCRDIEAQMGLENLPRISKQIKGRFGVLPHKIIARESSATIDIDSRPLESQSDVAFKAKAAIDRLVARGKLKAFNQDDVRDWIAKGASYTIIGSPYNDTARRRPQNIPEGHLRRMSQVLEQRVMTMRPTVGYVVIGEDVVLPDDYVADTAQSFVMPDGSSMSTGKINTSYVFSLTGIAADQVRATANPSKLGTSHLNSSSQDPDQIDFDATWEGNALKIKFAEDPQLSGPDELITKNLLLWLVGGLIALMTIAVIIIFKLKRKPKKP